MKRKLIKVGRFVSVMLIGLIALLLVSGQVNAKRAKQKIPAEAKATFMVMPELPANNVGGNHLGYFSLKLRQDQTRKVRIKLYNPTAHEITVYGQVKDATTNDDGSIDYLGTNSIEPQLLKQPGSQLVQVPKTTHLAASQTKWLTVKVTSKGRLFKGVKATAINLSADQFNQSATIKNHFVYAIGLVLNGRHLAKADYDQISSPLIKTRFIKGHKAAISVKIQNPDPTYLLKTTLHVKLQNQKWRFIRYESNRIKRKIAPSSSFYDNVLLGGKRLVPGAYRMTLTVKSQAYPKTIYKYVRITKNDAQYINRYNYEYLKHRNWLIAGLAAIILVVGITVDIRLKRKRNSHAKDD